MRGRRENIYVIAASAASRKARTDFGNSEGNGTNEQEESRMGTKIKNKKTILDFILSRKKAKPSKAKFFFQFQRRKFFPIFFMAFMNENTLFRTVGVRLRQRQWL